MTVASGSADTDVLRHCDLNDLSQTAVESSCRIVVVTTVLRGGYNYDSILLFDFEFSIRHDFRQRKCVALANDVIL